MQTSKSKNIKRYCALFFALLGVFNIIVTGFYSKIGTTDFVLLTLSFLPMLSNKRGLLIVFGFLGILASCYIGIACVVFHSNSSTQTPNFIYFMGYLLATSTLFASFGLTYAAIGTHDKNTFSLI